MSRLFTDVIRDIRGGKVVTIATDMLNELVLAVAETQKPGTFTLKLSVKPDKAEENQLTIEPSIDVKTPRPDLSGSVFFFDKEGNLTRTDPSQTEMQLSRVAERERPSPGITGEQLRDANMRSSVPA